MYEYYFGYRIFTSITTFKFAMCSCKKCNADDLLIKLLFADFKAISIKIFRTVKGRETNAKR